MDNILLKKDEINNIPEPNHTIIVITPFRLSFLAIQSIC